MQAVRLGQEQDHGRGRERGLRANIASEMRSPNVRFILNVCAASCLLASGSASPAVIRLRGGSGTMQYAPTQAKQTQVDTLLEEERKPDLKKVSSRLILEEMQNVSSATNCSKPQLLYRIDGKDVTEDEYLARVSTVSNRVIDSWVTQSDRGGLKEGDVLVPDHCSSIPEAVARVR